jgi:hypothetical protein
METRGAHHAELVLQHLRDEGYRPQVEL